MRKNYSIFFQNNFQQIFYKENSEKNIELEQSYTRRLVSAINKFAEPYNESGSVSR